jgi:hypothetical protein
MATKKVDFIVSEKGTSKAAGGFKKVDNSIAKAAKSAALYAGAYIGARGIINLTKNAIEAFGVQEDAEKRLTTALGKNADALIKQAGALQQVSTFGDEVIIGVQASIAAFVRDEGAIKRATAATLDLAAATGMDLKSAGDLVAKSLGSSTNALSRYGIEVTGAVGSSERLDTLTGNIASKFAGQAAAAADTMAGKMQQASNAIGDASEALGETFAEPVRLAAEGIKFLAEGMNAFIASVGGVGGHVTTAEQRLSALNKLVNEHADISIPNLIQIYTMLGMGYDETATRSDNFKMVLAEQAEQQERVNALTVQATAALESLDTVTMDATESYVRMNQELEKQGFLLVRNIELVEETSQVTTDLRTDWQKAGDAAKKAGNIALEGGLKGIAMSQNLGEASRALASQYVVEGVYAAVKSALASYPPPWNILAAGAAGIAANSLFNSVMPAATGADFTTSGPQMMLVGEAGREHVSVTPLEGPNINGPQGGNTFIFNGDIIGTDDYIENNLIPAVNLAITQGRAALA